MIEPQPACQKIVSGILVPILHFIDCVGAQPNTQDFVHSIVSPIVGGTLDSITVQATLDTGSGPVPWTGSVNYHLQADNVIPGLQNQQQGFTVPSTFTGIPVGDDYTVTYDGGGPAGANTTTYVSPTIVGMDSEHWNLTFTIAFRQSSLPAQVTTGSATAISSGGATLNGTVNPNGAVGEGFFQYSKDSSFISGVSTVGITNLPANNTVQAITANISGLSTGTTYYFRTVFQNSVNGEIQFGPAVSFTTNAIANSTDPPLLISRVDACASVNKNSFVCVNNSPPVLSSAPATVNGTYALFTGVSMTVSSLGQVGENGVLKASAATSFDISGTQATVYSFGASAFKDVLTISNPPLNGSPGLLYVSYTLNGTIAVTANGTAGLNVETYGGPSDSETMFQNYTSSVSGVFKAPAPIHFIYGQPFNLGLELWTEAGTRGSVVGTYPGDWAAPTTGTGSASASLSNTLILAGLVPTDANGNEASGAQFSSASGTRYSEEGVLESFSASSTCTELEIKDKTFKTKGAFLLGPRSKGINPVTEEVTIQVGTFSATIPPGSFRLNEHGRFGFHGVVNSAVLDLSIQSEKKDSRFEHEKSGGWFKYEARGWHTNLSGTSEPVSVRLILGGDGGMLTSKARCGNK